MQSRDGFMRFIERYPGFSREVPDNIYAVPRLESLIDFQTYRLIMSSSGLDYTETKENNLGLRNIDGIIISPERVLLIAQARKYFTESLSKDLQLNTDVTNLEINSKNIKINGSPFDFVIDCTWGHFSSLPINCYYEPTLLLYYECGTQFPALTLVDGPLGSLYPTEDPNIYTLSSVPHTPIGRYKTALEARAALAALSQQEINKKRLLMEDQIKYYLPSFGDHMRYIGPQFAIKTKPVGNADDRSCYVFRSDRLMTVLSGKIDTIFHAQERVLNFLETALTGISMRAESSLRREIEIGAF
ncbi:MAG: hypothetical protein BGP09_03265 [Rhizobium sp. 60-20]|nr:MAG: hypothetical protein BGP09_03265 [Rhizobium sp. 60-20]